MSQSPSEPKKFTGYHATAIIVTFFGVVICVNLVMATFAVSTFGGTIVDNSYVASQKYNQWLEQARAQEIHGWQVSPIARADAYAVLETSDRDGKPLEGAAISALVEHPVGRAEPFEVTFSETRPGHYQTTNPIPDGRWKFKLLITHQGKEMRLIGDLR